MKPAWSPDGAWIAFINESGTQADIYLVRPDGTDLRRLTESGDISRDGNLVWSPDGTSIAFSSDRGGKRDIYVLDVEEAIRNADDASVRRLTDQPRDDVGPAGRPAP